MLTYPSFTEDKKFGDCVRELITVEWTRRAGVILSGSNASSTTLKPCTLLGKVTATGKFAPLNPSASDGTQNVAGILVAEVDASTSDAPATICQRGPAKVNWDNLVLVNTLTAPQIVTAKAQLLALQIDTEITY